MIEVRQALSAYSLRDQFNCDETSLYWKRVPDKSLSTRSLPGRKKEKARITAHICCNADGSELMPTWYIGTAKTPRAFRAAGINIHNLNMIWRHNRNAWMTTVIMEEWLRWFDSKMVGRKVALLMDNFSAHEAAVHNINTSCYPLCNTLIIWLPPNATSRYQPLDQGIIRTWKAYWKRQWIHYMLSEYEAGKDPVNSMNVLKALRWGIQAWEMDMSPDTIIRCFQKALCNVEEVADSPEPAITDISNGLAQLRESNYIGDVMDINNFLNPADETVQDDLEHIDEQILAQFGPEIEEESDEEIEVLPKISVGEAIEALYKLRLHEEQQHEGNQAFIKDLLKHERILNARKLGGQQQKDIRAYF
ncbi:hypothetical protein LIPSTDRAFT_76436 [Lipomyces starkeyi NRRL Y-11557]|uniref:DDE-1 domain-containing protein n=1 Tax=Lipomyces starkeyi NRRL Y-11557 TaxID=675824 RepID=A0A1E3PUS5_LIPST|nr:hypothetical protein LIPSTDRAFT_76436 [Lipomyces starkeyi NRRL Y-11557]